MRVQLGRIEYNPVILYQLQVMACQPRTHARAFRVSPHMMYTSLTLCKALVAEMCLSISLETLQRTEAFGVHRDVRTGEGTRLNEGACVRI